MSAASRRRKRQVNIDLTERRERVLIFFAKKTESLSTNGTNKGDPSIGALIRRICDGEIKITHDNKQIDIPLSLYLDL